MNIQYRFSAKIMEKPKIMFRELRLEDDAKTEDNSRTEQLQEIHRDQKYVYS